MAQRSAVRLHLVAPSELGVGLDRALHEPVVSTNLTVRLSKCCDVIACSATKAAAMPPAMPWDCCITHTLLLDRAAYMVVTAMAASLHCAL